MHCSFPHGVSDLLRLNELMVDKYRCCLVKRDQINHVLAGLTVSLCSFIRDVDDAQKEAKRKFSEPRST